MVLFLHRLFWNITQGHFQSEYNLLVESEAKKRDRLKKRARPQLSTLSDSTDSLMGSSLDGDENGDYKGMDSSLDYDDDLSDEDGECGFKFFVYYFLFFFIYLFLTG